MWVLVGSCELWWVLVGAGKLCKKIPIRTYQNLSEPIRTHPTRTHLNSLRNLGSLRKRVCAIPKLPKLSKLSNVRAPPRSSL